MKPLNYVFTQLEITVKEEVLARCLLEILHKRGYITNTVFFKSLNLLEEEKEAKK